MSEFRVTLTACVAGNQHKAWKRRLDEPRLDEAGQPINAADTSQPDRAPDREVPDDVWEEQTHEFDTLEAAKLFIRGLPEQTTTHVVLEYLEPGAEGEDGTYVPIFIQDASGDHLDDAAPGVTPPHLVDSELPFEGLDDIPDAPPVLPSQAGAQ